MATKAIWRCIICATEAPERPPRHCPTCGTPASRWRLVVDRAPSLPVPEETAAEAQTEAPEATS
jgi:hypothetical protein